MPNNWNAIYLGQTSIIDPTEGNTAAENASALVGSTYGAVGAPLSENITFITTTDLGGASGVLDQNNRANGGGSSDRITYNIGAGNQTTTFDAAAQYNATLTYDNGATYTGTFVVIQDTTGQTFLVPPLTVGAEFTALTANPIRSITLNSLVNNSFSGLGQNRPTTNFLTCFAAGTRIMAAQGEVAVETIEPGDLVMTLDDGLQPVRWVGHQQVAGMGRFAPIRFRAGALGNTRDLWVSPQHRVLVTGWRAELLFGSDEVLVAARHLVNDQSIRPDPMGHIHYHHLMFDRHQIVLAEGCPAESFFPGDATMAAVDPDTRAEVLALFPDLAQAGSAYGPTARMVIRGTEAAALRQGPSLLT